MRENRLSGLEGGVVRERHPYPYPGKFRGSKREQRFRALNP